MSNAFLSVEDDVMKQNLPEALQLLTEKEHLTNEMPQLKLKFESGGLQIWTSS